MRKNAPFLRWGPHFWHSFAIILINFDSVSLSEIYYASFGEIWRNLVCKQSLCRGSLLKFCKKIPIFRGGAPFFRIVRWIFCAICTNVPFLGCFSGLLAKFDNFGFLNWGMAKENKVAPLMTKAIFTVGPPYLTWFPTFFNGFFPRSLLLIHMWKFCQSIKNVPSFNRELWQIMCWKTLNFQKKGVILAKKGP